MMQVKSIANVRQVGFMEKIALVIALIAIIATFAAARAASVRNEAHQQVGNIQALLKDISDITHRYFSEINEKSISLLNSKNQRANTYEALCNMKLDLLESSLSLLVRRCTSVLFFDANSPDFHESTIQLIGNLRDSISKHTYTIQSPYFSAYTIDAALTNIYSELNDYIGSRFRPILEGIPE